MTIGREVVTSRLAACANLLDGVTSIYFWEGTLCESGETLLLLKTRTESVSALIERVRQLHSYDCPSIVVWEASQGHQPFFEWVQQQTDSAGSQ